MMECNVCFEACSIERYFMPCGCRIRLCDECTGKVARLRRCLWCRTPPANPTDPARPHEDTQLYFDNRRLSTQLHDVLYANLLLRAEMFHFKRFHCYKAWGFFIGCVGGFGLGLAGSAVTSMVASIGFLAYVRLAELCY